MKLDDRMLEELSGLVTDEPPADESAMRDAAVARGLMREGEPVEGGVAGMLLREGRATARGLADLAREAHRRAADRRVDDLRAGRAVEWPESAVFGHYRLVRELGHGRTARVWLAWDAQLSRLVALKVLSGAQDDSVARFMREATITARLSHARIVPVYEVGEAHGSCYIAMKYVEGVSLEGRTLPPAEAARVVRDAARAIQHAHDQAIIHRDVKPGNLMWADDQVYVVDFGLARTVVPSNLSVPGLLAGTIPYMSPEQAEGKSATRLVDVYGLGATLYRLVTGRPPIEGASTLACLEKVRRLDYPAPRRVNPEVPAALEAIILKAMSERAHRYPTAEALATDLDRWLANGAVEANPGLPRVMRRVRRLLPPVAVAGLLVAVFAWAMTRTPPSPKGEDAAAAARRVQEAHQNLGLARQLVEEARLTLYRKGSTFSDTFFASLSKAADGARKSIALNDTAEAHYLLARVHQLAGDHDEAIREYDRSLAFGKAAPALLGKARAYLEQAADALVAGDEPQTTWLLASARRIFEDVPGLSRRMKEGEIESELTEAWRQLATDAGAAAGFARTRVEKHEEFAAVLGLACLRRQDYEGALRAFTAAVDRRPNYYQVFVYRASVLEATGAREFALAELDHALAVHPRHVPALLARARLHDALGNARAAAADRAAAARARQ